jgi:hypothetical protein
MTYSIVVCSVISIDIPENTILLLLFTGDYPITAVIIVHFAVIAKQRVCVPQYKLMFRLRKIDLMKTMEIKGYFREVTFP